MNNTLDTTFETNFNTAMKIINSKFDYDELIKMLLSDKIVEKQIAALELKEILSQEDAKVLVSNLTGQDGKVREAVAFKVNELIKNPEYLSYFINEEIFAILLQGIMDINGNVCRQIVDIIPVSKDFQKYLCNKLPKSINKILDDIKENDLNINAKQYAISKRNFQLYWCLEALYNVVELIDSDKIKDILFQTSEFYDYTIREKTAKILTRVNNSDINKLKEKLKNDENYYVRRYF